MHLRPKYLVRGVSRACSTLCEAMLGLLVLPGQPGCTSRRLE